MFFGVSTLIALQLIGGHRPAHVMYSNCIRCLNKSCVSQKIVYSQVDPYFNINLLLIV